MKRYCTIRTPLGDMVALAEGDHLRGLWFTDQKYVPEDAGDRVYAPDHPLFVELRRQLDAYFAGRLREFNLPLAPEGTPFQMAVWKLLRTIPRGTTTTYGALAIRMAQGREGRATSARAVGSAVGRNPIDIIIPCHRVVGADGSLTGYAGGLDRKAALLSLEKVKVSG